MLPSWVPDWSVQRAGIDLSRLRTYRYFCAGSSLPRAGIEKIPNGEGFVIRGFEIDRMADVSIAADPDQRDWAMDKVASQQSADDTEARFLRLVSCDLQMFPSNVANKRWDSSMISRLTDGIDKPALPFKHGFIRSDDP